MSRVLLLMGTHTYKAEAFLAAAARLDVDVVVGTDREQALSHLNPQGNLALPFTDLDAALQAVQQYATECPVHGVVAADDDGAPLASVVATALGLPHHPLDAVRTTTDKLSTRRALRAAGLRTPEVWSAPRTQSAEALAERVAFPCVLKPRNLSGSRGVIRADDRDDFLRAHARLRAILDRAQPRTAREPEASDDDIVVERFIPGLEVALEAIMEHGVLRPLALFDKPDPLDGPFFQETIYVTPSRHPQRLQDAAVETTRRAAAAFGLRHGAVHAELRLDAEGAWLLEAAPRCIGGLCARALAFGDGTQTLEELLVRNALGEPTASIQREPVASGVMMIPIPRAGILRSVAGVEAARALPGIDEVRISVPPGQLVEPPPEGGRYLGFIFARAAQAADVEEALRASHAKLHIRTETAA